MRIVRGKNDLKRAARATSDLRAVKEKRRQVEHKVDRLNRILARGPEWLSDEDRQFIKELEAEYPGLFT